MSWIVGIAMTVTSAGSPMALSCTVEGGAKTGLDAKAICARFVEQLSKEAGRSYALVPAAKPSGDGMTVAIRFMGGDTVSATAMLIVAGHARPLETRMISSSDRPLGLDSIGLLARDVARAAARVD